MARRKGRQRLRNAAQAQAAAEFNPQIQGVRRGAQHAIAGLKSEEDPLLAGIQAAEQQLMQSGNLTPRDQARATLEFSHDTAEVPQSIASQALTQREDAQQQIQDLVTARGQSEGSILSQLLTAAREHAQGIRDEENAEARGTAQDLIKAEQEKARHLGTYAPSPEELAKIHHGGLTPTQSRAAHEDHEDANYWAHAYVKAAKETLQSPDADPKKKEALEAAGFTASPSDWGEQQWEELAQKVVEKTHKVDLSQKAVHAVRNHFQGSGQGLSLLGQLGSAAVGAAAGPATAGILKGLGHLAGQY